MNTCYLANGLWVTMDQLRKELMLGDGLLYPIHVLLRLVHQSLQSLLKECPQFAIFVD